MKREMAAPVARDATINDNFLILAAASTGWPGITSLERTSESGSCASLLNDVIVDTVLYGTES